MIWREAIARVAALGFRWRSSLQLRVITVTLMAGLVAVGAIAAFLTTQVRDGLFEQRLAQLLAESGRSAAQTQATLDASTASTVGDLPPLFQRVVATAQVGGSDDREVFLLRSKA